LKNALDFLLFLDTLANHKGRRIQPLLPIFLFVNKRFIFFTLILMTLLLQFQYPTCAVQVAIHVMPTLVVLMLLIHLFNAPANRDLCTWTMERCFPSVVLMQLNVQRELTA